MKGSNQSLFHHAALRAKTIQIVSMPIMFIFAVFGCLSNILICYTIYKKKELHTPTFYLIINMAISDCFIFLISSAIVVNNYMVSLNVMTTTYLITFCKLLPFVNLTAYISSTFTLAVISIERKHIISVWTRRRSLLSSKTKIWIAIGLSWIIGIATAAPILIFMTISRDDPWSCNIANSNRHRIYNIIYFMSLFLIAYLIPLIIIYANYTQVVAYLIRKLTSKNQNHQKFVKLHRKRQIRVIKMLLIITTAFLILSFPLFLLYLVSAFSGRNSVDYISVKNPTMSILAQFAFLLTVLSCIQHPILYLTFNATIRQGIQFLRPCLYRRRRKIFHLVY